MTSKELELLAKMTVELLRDNKVDFVIRTWESAYTDNPTAVKERPENE